jgi:hypothetical protein
VVEDLEYLKIFEEPLNLKELMDSDQVFADLGKKFGFSNADQMDKKRKKKS